MWTNTVIKENNMKEISILPSLHRLCAKFLAIHLPNDMSRQMGNSLKVIVIVAFVQRVKAQYYRSTSANKGDGKPERSLCILLAEDNRVNQRFALHALTKQGYDVTVVNNGAEAVNAWENDSFDVVLMDVQMPKVDGYEATRRIRNREKGKAMRTPIIAMTAHTMRGSRARCLEAGMDGYLMKPIDAAAVKAEIDRVLIIHPQTD